MANDKDTNAFSAKCSVCGDNFTSLQECLKHEIIRHSLQRRSSQQNRVQKRFNATSKFLNADEKLLERERLRKKLNNCETGQELRTILDIFCMNSENLGLIFTRIQTCLEKELRSAGIVKIYPFGSIASGLALRDCDIDIYLDASNIQTSPTHKHTENNDLATRQRMAFNRINNLLYRSKHFSDVFAIRRARVPIIKCKHNDTGFSIDINISFPSSRENTQFIYDLVNSDVRIHELMLFLKLWAKNMQIIGRDNMTSYCLVTMVIFFLQQPWTLEIKANDKSDSRILKSIKELQENCPFHMVQGVNYAYDLSNEENKPKIPEAVTIWDLIKEFFNFYHNFDFENHIISPFYGKPVPKTNLTQDKCEEYYKQLRTITQYLQGEQTNDLQIDRCMCVQDAFCLNQNTAKNISPQNKQYILCCLQNAQKICENPNKLKLAPLYEQLLFETINMNANKNKDKIKCEEIADLEKLQDPANESIKETDNQNSLVYTVLPSKANLRAVATKYPDITDAEELLRGWCQHYTEAIEIILTKLYRMDVQKQQPAQQKQQKLHKEEQDKELNKCWFIFCTVDLWSNRCFQKSLQTTFMTYQMEQTERLHALRRQDPKFSVTLNGILKLNTLPSYMGIEIRLEITEGSPASSLNKKGPLRKFFNTLKSTLQSCNFKEFLNINDINANDDDETKVADTVNNTVNADN